MKLCNYLSNIALLSALRGNKFELQKIILSVGFALLPSIKLTSLQKIKGESTDTMFAILPSLGENDFFELHSVPFLIYDYNSLYKRYIIKIEFLREKTS
ncbi:MAG: hypothetical protein RXO36_04735 [Candidatus Nanopusillus acidilobi]